MNAYDYNTKKEYLYFIGGEPHHFCLSGVGALSNAVPAPATVDTHKYMFETIWNSSLLFIGLPVIEKKH
jgi:hypothetical protein